MSFSLAERDQLIHVRAGEILFAPIRPTDADAIDALRLAQTEMNPRVAATEITLRPVYQPYPSARAGLDAHFRAIGVSSPCGIEDANHEPVPALRSNVTIQAGRTGDRGHQ